MFVVDEFYFVANTDVLLAGMKNYGRALIALSSTHGVPNTLNNPLPAMSVAPTDANGHPTLRATFARRCAACARLRRPFCPHTPLSVPWQRHSEAGDQEHDVVLTAPGGPLLSAKARMRMLGADVGAPVARAPLVVGLDPGGGRSQTAGVALRLHERGCAVVGVLASTREAGQHLADAAQFVADVAEQHGLGRLVVVYVENNLGAAAAAIVAGIVAARRPNVVVAREPGQPVAGFTTAEKTRLWFADMLHAWVELAPALALAPERECTLVLAAGRGEVRVRGHAGAYADAAALLHAHLGNVQRGPLGPVFKRGEARAADDDLFFAAGMALRMLVMAAPDYAGTYAAQPGRAPGARITGFRVVAPSDMANLYAHGCE